MTASSVKINLRSVNEQTPLPEVNPSTLSRLCMRIQRIFSNCHRSSVDRLPRASLAERFPSYGNLLYLGQEGVPEVYYQARTAWDFQFPQEVSSIYRPEPYLHYRHLTYRLSPFPPSPRPLRSTTSLMTDNNMTDNNWEEPQQRISQHEKSLSHNAGACDFFNRVLEAHLQRIQSGIEELDDQIKTIQMHRLDTTILLQKREEWVNDIDNFEAFDSDAYLTILQKLVEQAIASKKPLMEAGNPTEELPVALHNLGKELETLRISQDSAMRQGKIRAIASELQQGNTTCKVALFNAWKGKLGSAEFIHLKKLATNPLLDASSRH